MYICDFFSKKVLKILKSLKDANSLNVCPFLFTHSSPKVPTTPSMGWFPALALRETRLRETNWSSKNGGFADGLVILPRKTKYSKAKTHSLGYRRIK
jgi:hypothetical protein